RGSSLRLRGCGRVVLPASFGRQRPKSENTHSPERDEGVRAVCISDRDGGARIGDLKEEGRVPLITSTDQNNDKLQERPPARKPALARWVLQRGEVVEEFVERLKVLS